MTQPSAHRSGHPLPKTTSSCRAGSETFSLVGKYCSYGVYLRQARKSTGLERLATSGGGLSGPRLRSRLPGRSLHWDAGDSRFTVEEYRVVRRVVLGYTDREIALELFMSDSTVRYHLRKVFARFGIRRRIELVQLLTSTTHESEATADLDVLAEV